MYEILLVDDDRAIRYQLKKMQLWNAYGFHIGDEAADGSEALAKICAGRFDAVFVDIKMPGINGIELIAELRDRHNDICVVIMSSHREFTYARQGIRLGAFDYLLKPVNEENLAPLLKELKAHLDGRASDIGFRAKAKETLEASLRMPYSSQDEAMLLSLITDKPDSAGAFAQELGERVSEFYDQDVFKVATILECSYGNVSRALMERFPWFAGLDAVENGGVHFHLLENIALLIHVYREKIEGYSALVKKMHLDKPDSLIKALCEYAIRNAGGDISLETAGAELGYSRKYLGKAFREKTGEGFPEYLTKIRMERAKTYLLTNRYKNYEVSEMLGYKNPDYFCRLFKNYFGVTPSEFKKS